MDENHCDIIQGFIAIKRDPQARGTQSVRKVQHNMPGNNEEERPSYNERARYNKQVSSEKMARNVKRKRQTYKSEPANPASPEPQQQLESSFEPSFKRSALQIPFEAIDLRPQIIHVSQISIVELTTRLRVIRYLYERASRC